MASSVRRRARRGQAHIRKKTWTIKDGSVRTCWEKQVYVTDVLGKRRRVSISASTLREVEQKRVASERSKASSHASFSSFLDRVLEWVATNRKFKTYELRRGIVKNHIRPYLGRVPLASLRPEMIDRLLTRDLRDLGSRMRLEVYKTLRWALGIALDEGLISRQPCLRKYRPTHRDNSHHALSTEAVSRLLRAAKDADYFAFFALAVDTGMRPGELFGLQWSDVDLDAGTVIVRATLTQDYDGNLVRTEPKASRSRKLELAWQTALALREHKARQHPLGDYVFADINGEPLKKDNFLRNVFRPITQTAGIAPARLYDLRHTTATLLLTDGESVKAVAERLGHSSAKMTLDVYADAIPTRGTSSAQKMGRILFRANSGINGGIKNGQVAGKKTQSLVA